MLNVGVDFGTTNVRISTWDPGEPGNTPEPSIIGQADSRIMPAVIAFQKQPNGPVVTLIGEEADLDELDDDPNTVVVSNIKRWALSGDDFVKWNLDAEQLELPEWWDAENHCVNVFGESYPVMDIIRYILAEAFRRAGITERFEWRAGCPVHAGLDYRIGLARIMSDLSGVDGGPAWVIEEPILFLVLALNLGTLGPGSYLVYDVGGGSFDCAIAVIEEDESGTVVYAADGDPLLGGLYIDELLKDYLSLTKVTRSLRSVKESVTTPDGPSLPVDADTSLSFVDLETALTKRHFMDDTQKPMRLAYISAKTVWKTTGDSPTTSVPQCRLGQLPTALNRDLDGIILCGGPTKSPVFQRWFIENQYEEGKVKTAESLLGNQIFEPHLTALSAGACYVSAGDYRPLYTSRLPVKVTLRNARTDESVNYTPYEHFARNFNPFRNFVSPRLSPQSGQDAAFELIISEADGSNPVPRPVDFGKGGVSRGSVLAPRFGIDMLGQVWIENDGRFWVEIEDPPWQSNQQRVARERIIARQRGYEAREEGRVGVIIRPDPAQNF